MAGAAARAAEAAAEITKRDMPRAAELLGDPDTYHAYYARAAGEEWRPPVAKAAGPDHRAEIREAVAGDDFAELDRLVRLPDGGRQYHEMLRAGELEAAVAEGIAKRSRTPADVREAEVARWRECIRAMLKARDRKGMEAARRQGGAGFEAAWIAMSTAGERMTM